MVEWTLSGFKQKIIFIILIALIFRINVYPIQPFSDEQTYDWLAYNLAQGRLNTGSSFTSVYAQFGAVKADNSVEPWLDHPILYPLIISFFKKISMIFLNNDLTFYNVRLISVLLFCLPMIYISILTCKNEFETRSAIIAGLLLAIVPSIVHQQRMIFLDISVTFFSMLSLYTLKRYFNLYNIKWLVFSSIFAGLSALSKGTGVFAIGAVVLSLILQSKETIKNRISKSFLAFTIGFSLFLIYPLYGSILDFELLKAISLTQLSRGNERCTEWLVRSMFEYPWNFNFDYDWFLLLGWIGLAYSIVSSLKEKRMGLISIWIISYLAVLIFVSKCAYYQTQIVLYPFMAILIGKMSADFIDKAIAKLKMR